ncbi:MAG: DNA polymerase III subunit gamma/tau [Clostridia bacterium]|nr:DNA polymerase III subunit gamma/tau [Clostridia bacterium]
MSHLALYRTFRPKTLDDVVRQEHVVTVLKNQITSGRIGHAYLFCGPRGTGKTSIAKIFAAAINCAAPVNGSPCGKCETCEALKNPANLDITEIDAASNNGVDEIRDLREKVQYPPTSGKYKVYIVDEVHMLSQQAFNALLKTLEEPPSHAVFILATTEPHRLPATIISRCQRFDFKRIDSVTIAQRLKTVLDDAGADVADDAIDLIARLSEGGMRDALSLADQVVGMSDSTVTSDDVVRITGGANAAFLANISKLLIEGSLGEALNTLDGALADGADAAMIARDLARYLRDMLICISVDDPVRILRRDVQSVQYMTTLGNDAGKAWLTNALKLLLALDGTMRYALSPCVALETTLAQIVMGEASNNSALTALEHKVEMLEKKLASGAFSPAVPKEGQVSPTEALAAENFPKAQSMPAPKPAAKKYTEAKGWKGVMETIKRVRMPLYSALLKARCDEDGERLIVSFSKDDMIYARLAQKPDALELIQKTASDVYEKSVKVEIATYEDDSFDQKRVEQNARALFGDKLTIQ